MRLDGFGIHAAEKRVARAANFLAFNSIAAKEVAQKPAPCPVHRIDKKPKLRRAQTVPIHQSCQRFQIRRTHIERSNQILSWRKCRHTIVQHLAKLRFNLSNNRGRSRTSVTRLKFYAIPAEWIVARRDLNSPRCPAQPHKQRKSRRGTNFSRQ